MTKNEYHKLAMTTPNPAFYDRKDFISRIDELNNDSVYPFHMPGHKRNTELGIDPYRIDITEIDGYDDLHHPEGDILDLEKKISAMTGSYKSYVLINGSTCGILSAISAVTNYSDSIIVARNSHKSAYNALGLRGLHADYVIPGYCDEIGINSHINPADVEALLTENPGKYKAVYITSPTYEGVVSDIESIAKVAHAHNIPLIVDEAHGAHFGFDDRFPKSAISLGADIVIQSSHKTLPSMTQTAVAHVNYGYFDIKKFEYYLSVYQTSSPSYVLMASLWKAYTLLENSQKEYFDSYYGKLSKFRQSCSNFVNIFMVDNVDRSWFFDYDCGKIVLYSPKCGGNELYQMLRERKLQPEMSSCRYVIMMTSIMDSEEGFERLGRALAEIDVLLNDYATFRTQKIGVIREVMGNHIPKTDMRISEALERESSLKELNCGCISADYIYVYPPGIPLLVPGETADEVTINEIERYMADGFDVRHVVKDRDDKLYIMGI